jgi:hypothetical protein
MVCVVKLSMSESTLSSSSFSFLLFFWAFSNFGTFQTALGVLFRSSHVEDHAKAINSMADLFAETFGDHITPLRSDSNVYSMCFL